jgi:hypothetical protein
VQLFSVRQLLSEMNGFLFNGTIIAFATYLNFTPMKTMLQLYKRKPVIALLLLGVCFFLYAITIIFIIVFLAVAFTG